MIERRRFLKTGAAASAAVFLSGHTPYQQWVVYRRKHLLIGCHKDDPRTYDLARFTVEILGAQLPAAKARVARAPHAGRLASLLGTGQMDVAIIDAASAVAMTEGSGIFAPYGKTALHLLAPINNRVLVAQTDLPASHAWLLTKALIDKELQTGPNSLNESGLQWHPGSAKFLHGHPEPTEG